MYRNEVIKELKPVYLRKKPKKLEVTLDEVVATATKLKFYMDGDTLVYNADAFNLAEGSMITCNYQPTSPCILAEDILKTR